MAEIRKVAVVGAGTMGNGIVHVFAQHGYDVTYCSNSDMLAPDRALKCKAFLSNGHDEYWDIRQFRSVERMRDEINPG